MYESKQLEIEVKYRIQQIEVVIENLRKLGAEYVSEEYQTDYYLQHPCKDFKETDEALRIRVEDSKYYLTYKGPRISDVAKVRYEAEATISDYNSVLSIFKALGFKVYAILKKRRILYNLGNFKISLDIVENLGKFIEIEYVVENEDLEEAIKKLDNLSLKLGLNPSEKIIKSYLELYLEAIGGLNE